MGGGIRRERRVAPGKILVVEIDGGEVVRLEIGDAGPRLGANDLPALHSGHVARAHEIHRDRRKIGTRSVRRDRQGNVEARRD